MDGHFKGFLLLSGCVLRVSVVSCCVIILGSWFPLIYKTVNVKIANGRSLLYFIINNNSTNYAALIDSKRLCALHCEDKGRNVGPHLGAWVLCVDTA